PPSASKALSGHRRPSEAAAMSQPWDLPERDATPEPVAFPSRRRWLRWAGLGAAGAAAAAAGGWWWWLHGGSNAGVLAARNGDGPGAGLYPVSRSPKFAGVITPLTDEGEAARYTNFYEFSSYKEVVWRKVGPFKTLPWTVEVTGLVANPRTWDVDDLVRAFP